MILPDSISDMSWNASAYKGLMKVKRKLMVVYTARWTNAVKGEKRLWPCRTGAPGYNRGQTEGS
ncbi:MAG: hypothetical protein V3S39_08325 [Thermodesulfobacteriota bacterium]